MLNMSDDTATVRLYIPQVDLRPRVKPFRCCHDQFGNACCSPRDVTRCVVAVVRRRSNMQVYMSKHTSTQPLAPRYIYIYIYIYIYHIFIYTYVYIYIYTYVKIYEPIHTYAASRSTAQSNTQIIVFGSIG